MAQSKSKAKADDCVNDDEVQDTYGDTCTDYYDDKPEECGWYDSDTFTAAESCCACMGLSETGSYSSYEYADVNPTFTYSYINDGGMSYYSDDGYEYTYSTVYTYSYMDGDFDYTYSYIDGDYEFTYSYIDGDYDYTYSYMDGDYDYEFTYMDGDHDYDYTYGTDGGMYYYSDDG